jgi:HK97 family phage prohead protease
MALASTPTLDRDHEIIRVDAWDLSDFRRHPVLMVVHDYQKLWVGKITEIAAKTEGLFFRAVFAKTVAAEEVWQLIKSTGIAAFSVGFLPITSESVQIKNLTAAEQRAALAAGLTLDSSIRVFTKASLMEISVVGVPSNTSATLISWKALAKNASVRDALEEITISDLKDSDIVYPITKDELDRRLQEIEILKPENVRKIADESIRKTMTAFTGKAIEIARVHQVVEATIKKLIEERVELALAKIRGRVI